MAVVEVARSVPGELSAHLPHLLSGPHEGETVAMWRLGLERWVNV